MAYLRAAYLGRMACYIDNSTEVTYTTRGERMTTSNAFAKIGAETPRDGLCPSLQRQDAGLAPHVGLTLQRHGPKVQGFGVYWHLYR